jgi:hypothetical protein
MRMANEGQVSIDGVIKDMPMHVGKFFFLVTFHVVKFKVDKSNQVILGRPFSAKANMIIDFEDMTVILGDWDRQRFRMVRTPREHENPKHGKYKNGHEHDGIFSDTNELHKSFVGDTNLSRVKKKGEICMNVPENIHGPSVNVPGEIRERSWDVHGDSKMKLQRKKSLDSPYYATDQHEESPASIPRRSSNVPSHVPKKSNGRAKHDPWTNHPPDDEFDPTTPPHYHEDVSERGFEYIDPS